MVRMLLLKPRTGHAIAAGNGVASLLPFPCPPMPLPKPSNPTLPTRREVAVAERRWEKGLAPKKTHQRTTSRAHRHFECHHSKPSNHIMINFYHHPRGLIQLLYAAIASSMCTLCCDSSRLNPRMIHLPQYPLSIMFFRR
jgi:hypothetical protein